MTSLVFSLVGKARGAEARTSEDIGRLNWSPNMETIPACRMRRVNLTSQHWHEPDASTVDPIPMIRRSLLTLCWVRLQAKLCRLYRCCLRWSGTSTPLQKGITFNDACVTRMFAQPRLHHYCGSFFQRLTDQKRHLSVRQSFKVLLVPLVNHCPQPKACAEA